MMVVYLSYVEQLDIIIWVMVDSYVLYFDCR